MSLRYRFKWLHGQKEYFHTNIVQFAKISHYFEQYLSPVIFIDIYFNLSVSSWFWHWVWICCKKIQWFGTVGNFCWLKEIFDSVKMTFYKNKLNTIVPSSLYASLCSLNRVRSLQCSWNLFALHSTDFAFIWFAYMVIFVSKRY